MVNGGSLPARRWPACPISSVVASVKAQFPLLRLVMDLLYTTSICLKSHFINTGFQSVSEHYASPAAFQLYLFVIAFPEFSTIFCRSLVLLKPLNVPYNIVDLSGEPHTSQRMHKAPPTMQSVTDRRTDRRKNDDANSRSYCVAVRSAKN